MYVRSSHLGENATVCGRIANRSVCHAAVPLLDFNTTRSNSFHYYVVYPVIFYHSELHELADVYAAQAYGIQNKRKSDIYKLFMTSRDLCGALPLISVQSHYTNRKQSIVHEESAPAIQSSADKKNVNHVINQKAPTRPRHL